MDGVGEAGPAGICPGLLYCHLPGDPTRRCLAALVSGTLPSASQTWSHPLTALLLWVYSVHLDCLRSGVDGLAFDPLAASWGLTPAAYESCARLAASWGRPLLLLGGGGYHSPSAAVTWAKVLVALMGRQLPEDIPEHDHFPQYGPAFTLASGAAHGCSCGNITLPHSSLSLSWLAAQPACLPSWLSHSPILQMCGRRVLLQASRRLYSSGAALVPPGLPAPPIRLAVSPCSFIPSSFPLVVLLPLASAQSPSGSCQEIPAARLK